MEVCACTHIICYRFSTQPKNWFVPLVASFPSTTTTTNPGHAVLPILRQQPHHWRWRRYAGQVLLSAFGWLVGGKCVEKLAGLDGPPDEGRYRPRPCREDGLEEVIYHAMIRTRNRIGPNTRDVWERTRRLKTDSDAVGRWRRRDACASTPGVARCTEHSAPRKQQQAGILSGTGASRLVAKKACGGKTTFTPL